MINNFDDVAKLLDTFEDNYSRELLIKFYALKLYFLTGNTRILREFLTPRERLLSLNDYINWASNIKYSFLYRVWKYGRYRFKGNMPEPPAVYYIHGIKELDISPGPHSIAFDIGGYIGDSAVTLATNFSEVHSFEPFRQNMRYLRQNIKYFSNIQAHEIALGDRETEMFIQPYENEPHGDVRLTEDQTGEKIRVCTLDTFVKQNIDNFSGIIDNYSLIKMDTEGFEIPVLEGARMVIKQYLPQLVISAYHKPSDVVDIVRLLEAYVGDEYNITFRHHQRWVCCEFVIIAKSKDSDSYKPKTG
jgi:FkbM family methyltransferase